MLVYVRDNLIPGKFRTIVGCNDCTNKGGSLTRPAFLQTWIDDGENHLKLVKNESITYKNTPAAFTGLCAHNRPCGFSTPDQSIIRTKDSNLLMALYGHAAGGWEYSPSHSNSSSGLELDVLANHRKMIHFCFFVPFCFFASSRTDCRCFLRIFSISFGG